jgi:hypothetical protein
MGFIFCNSYMVIPGSKGFVPYNFLCVCNWQYFSRRRVNAAKRNEHEQKAAAPIFHLIFMHWIGSSDSKAITCLVINWYNGSFYDIIVVKPGGDQFVAPFA